MKKILCVLLLSALVLCLFSCSKFDESYVYDGHSLIGKWQEEDYEEELYLSYEFFKDGVFEQKTYKYGIEVAKAQGTYTANGSTLVVEFKNENGTSTFIENRFCITEDRELVMIYLDKENEMEEEEMVLIPFEIEFNEPDSELFGTWEDTQYENELWTFNKNGTISVSKIGARTEKWLYSVNDDTIYTIFDIGDGILLDTVIEWDYDIDDGILTMEAEINGTDVEKTFERK